MKNEAQIFEKAIEMSCSSRYRFEEVQAYVFEACGYNQFIAKEILKKLDFYLEYII